MPAAVAIDTIPAAVRRLASRALPAGAAAAGHVRLTQVGEMWQRPGGRALRFTAVEELATDEVAFSWRARFAIAGVPCLRVTDRFAGGEGTLEAHLLGLIPVMRKRGAALSEGEALRYLSELPWNPGALLRNRRLRWRELGDGAIEVATLVGAVTVALKLELDAAGDVVRVSTPARARLGDSRPRPWVGEFSDYATLGGMRVPTRGEVRWELPAGPFTYWRGEVTSLR